MRHLPSRVVPEVPLFLLFLFTGSFFYYTVDYDNTSSRLYLVSAAVDFGVLHIDPFASMTGDTSISGGHVYSNKAIGAPLLAVPVYWFLRKIEPWRDSPPLTKGLRYGIRLVTTTLPFAFLGIGLFRAARFLGCPPGRSVLMACAHGLGSIALIHAGLFSGHGIAAAFSFLSFLGLMCRRKRAPSFFFGFLLGLSAGIAALADYTAMFIAGILLLYALCSPVGVREKCGFCMGGAVCALLLAYYNWKCFGSPLSMSYAHQGTEIFASESQHGLLGIGTPRWDAVLALLASPGRGLFFIMPVFLFSLDGIRRMLGNRDLRAEGVLIVSIALGYLLMIGGFYGWHGGWTFGPRYFIPMLPFLALPIAFAGWSSLPFWVSMGVSVLQVQVVAMSLPHCPEVIQNPIAELVLPCMSKGYLAETWPGWLGLPGSWTLGLYVGVCASLFLGLWFWSHRASEPKTAPSSASKALRFAVLLWVAVTLLMVSLVRTDPPELVSLYREGLQYHRIHRDVIQRHLQELAESYLAAQGSRKTERR